MDATPPDATGHELVDAAVRTVAALDVGPEPDALADHVTAYEQAHGHLRRALDDRSA